MIDYARVAQTLKELKEFYTQPLTPDLECWRVHKTLTAAAALCEAHAAPVDETKERAEFEKRASASGYDITHHESGDYVERDTNEACVWWLNRARSDARAKVAEKEAENTRLRAENERRRGGATRRQSWIKLERRHRVTRSGAKESGDGCK